MKKIGIFLSSTLLLATVMFMPHQVHAQSNALGVNPRREYTVAPGGKVTDTLFVNNLNGTDALTIQLEALDFKAQDQTGTPSLLLKQVEPTRWSLKPYLSIPGQYTVPAGKSIEIPFSVSVPSNVGAGSYYSAVRYLSVNAQTGQNVNLSSSAVTLMFVRVTGEAKSNLSLQNFGAFIPNNDASGGAFQSFFSASKPRYISYILRNNGNLAEQPAGSVIIKDTFGAVDTFIQDANPSKNLVLLEQSRRIDLCLNEVKSTVKNPNTGADVEKKDCNDPSPKPGRYTATINLVYGDAGNTQGEIKETVTFWYLPIWFVLLVALVLVALGLGVWFLIKKVRNFKKPTYGGTRRR